jgi:X-X-X-Leu-X-X-Gly heptad repeat protein
MGFRSSFSKSLFQSGPGYRANLAQSGKLCGSFGGMDSASELADGVADLADGVSEHADGVATKHGTALHGTRLPRTTRCTKKMQLSAKLGYIHCDAEDVIECAAHLEWPSGRALGGGADSSMCECEYVSGTLPPNSSPILPTHTRWSRVLCFSPS